MYMFAMIALVVLQIFTAVIAVYFYMSAKKIESKETQPYNQFLIGVSAISFAVTILFLFFAFVSDRFEVSENLGQVGDFVGGLTNPVLSFIALIVLLRTTLIQTGEARKTSLIMLQQQQLMEEERFEAAFYKLLERFESVAEMNLRIRHSPKDRLTIGLRAVQDLRKKRADFDKLPLRDQVKNSKAHVRLVLKNDKISKAVARVCKVFYYLDGSNLPRKRKEYYFSLVMDAMEPCEIVMFLSSAFVVRGLRRKVKKYRPAKIIQRQFFAIGIIHDYFCEKTLSIPPLAVKS